MEAAGVECARGAQAHCLNLPERFRSPTGPAIFALARLQENFSHTGRGVIRKLLGINSLELAYYLPSFGLAD